MNYTNKANLPAPLVAALTYSDYDGAKYDITASGLVVPPRIRQLEKRHDSEIAVDVSELIYRVMGAVGHKLMEHAHVDNVLREERLSTEVLGWTVGGKFDLLRTHESVLSNQNDYAIDDYKFTSLWAAKDAKPEWEFQLNVYAWLAGLYNFNITQLRSINIFRDWSKPKAHREKDKGYPQEQVMVREVAVWAKEIQTLKITESVFNHQKAATLSDDELPLCTPAERWQKPEVWAVKKKGNKRAVPGGLCKSEGEAHEFAYNAPGINYEIEHRPGEDTRCLHYCSVRPFCSYGKTLTETEEVGA